MQQRGALLLHPRFSAIIFLLIEHRFYGYSFVSSFDVNKSQNISEDIAMGNCIHAVIECDTIYLDHAWQSSKGRNLEYRDAKIYDK